MRIIVIPVSFNSDFIGSASERFRCDWLLPYLPTTKYDGTQDLNDFDVIIYQKAFHPGLVEQYKHKLQIYDDTDDIRRHGESVPLFCQYLNQMDFVTVSTVGLQAQFQRHVDVPVHVVPDGHEFSVYTLKKTHKDVMPKFVWFGYADNFELVCSNPRLLMHVADHLIVVAERPVGIGEFVPYDPSTIQESILRGDIVLNLQHPLKSNNKTVTAWALGMPVAHTEEDVIRLAHFDERVKDVEARKDLDQFHVRHSAARLRYLIDRRGQRLKVLVSVPTEGMIHKFVAAALLKLIRDARYSLRIIMPTHRPLENNLHHIINDVLKDGYDFWLNIDSDNPPIQNPLDLVDWDLDVVGFPTPVWHWEREKDNGNRPIYWNAYKKKAGGFTEWPEKNGLQEVDAIGGGCFLAARRVLEHPDMTACFLRMWNEDGTLDYGNDLAFSQRATAAGFRLWAHYDYQCLHFHEMELQEVSTAMGKFFEKLSAERCLTP